MRILFWLSLILQSGIVVAESPQHFKVYRLLKDESFLIKNTSSAKPGMVIYIYNKEQFQGTGKILKCKKSVCLAKVVQKEKDFYFQLSMVYTFTKTEKLEATSEAQSKSGVYAGIGGMLGYSTQIGHWREANENTHYDFGVESISTTLGSIGVSGYGMSAGLDYSLFKWGKIHSPTFLRLIAALINLDFSKISDENYNSGSQAIFQFEVGQAIRYQINKHLSLAAGLGFSYNTFSSIVTDDVTGNEYQVPFAGGFLVGNLRAEYTF